MDPEFQFVLIAVMVFEVIRGLLLSFPIISLVYEIVYLCSCCIFPSFIVGEIFSYYVVGGIC